MTKAPDPIAVLKAAGHTEAAELLAALKPVEPAEGETSETPAPTTPQTRAMSLAEQQREAEGQYLLGEMRRAGILEQYETETTP